ncbi:MAG: hypothetical protein Q4F17_07050 [Eubacteriales bacterium]|nr:hypothetical protein [Eubacteriales bacterium]
MFAKLLKQEFRATGKAMAVLCLSALGLGLAGGLSGGCLAAANLAEQNKFIETLCAMIAVFSGIFIAVCGVGTLVLMIARFYKSRFTDEGYLTFTLPVTTHQVLLSSLVSSVLNVLLGILAVAGGYLLMGLVSVSFVEGFWGTLWENLPEFWQMLVKGLKETWQARYLGYILLTLYSLLASAVSQLVSVMLAVTIGAIIAKKHKILAAVGVYYGINLAVSIVGINSLVFGIMQNTHGVSFVSVMGPMAISATLIALAGYFVTYYLVDRKLNLP